jgi:predicted Zn-dependent protease
MRRWLTACAVGLVVAVSVPATAQRVAEDEGVKVRRPSMLRKIVSAERIEKAGIEQFGQLRDQAIARKSLVPTDDAQAKRLQRITQDLLPHTGKWNARAKGWQWETILIRAPTLNAFCLPGGKIAVFTGLLDTLKLTDDEIAMVMGHEMAHALREHARSRTAKTTLTNVGTRTISILLGGNMGEIARVSGGLMTLKFNRDDERDADLVGMELAARAGYDPESGITLWEKMNALPKSTPPPWLSTHPSGEYRIKLFKDNLKRLKPIYEKARATRPPAAN